MTGSLSLAHRHGPYLKYCKYYWWCGSGTAGSWNGIAFLQCCFSLIVPHTSLLLIKVLVTWSEVVKHPWARSGRRNVGFKKQANNSKSPMCHWPNANVAALALAVPAHKASFMQGTPLLINWISSLMQFCPHYLEAFYPNRDNLNIPAGKDYH